MRSNWLDRDALLWVLGLSASDRLHDAAMLQSEPSQDWRANLEAVLLMSREREAMGVRDPYSIFALARRAFAFATDAAPIEAVIDNVMLPVREILVQLTDLLDVASDEGDPSFETVERLGAAYTAVSVWHEYQTPWVDADSRESADGWLGGQSSA